MISPVSLVVLITSLVAVNCAEIVEECIRSNGVEYRGKQQKSFSGNICLNWKSTTRDYDITQQTGMDTGVGDHNFCRNPDGSERPWCYISGADGQLQREACAIDPCQDQFSQEAPVPTATDVPTYPKTYSTEQVSKSIPKQREGAVVQPVMGVSQRVRTGSKKKKDLGMLGYVLGIIMMAIIIILGVGITLGYIYKRGRDLKKQHEQRVYEREMHRITLPLSAFSNPTCDLAGENTVVVLVEPGEQIQAQVIGEGSDPLIGPAGTPGA